MLKKINRISNKLLIQKLLKKGQQFKNKYFIFKFLNSAESVSKFAIVVSKKTAQKAVERNKIRRRVSESLRLNMQTLKNNVVSVVIVNKTAKSASYEELNSGILEFYNLHKQHVQ